MISRWITIPAILFTLSLLLNSTLLASYLGRGRSYYMYKKYDKAKEMFLKELEERENGNAYYFLGEIEKREGNYKKAMEYYQKAIINRISGKYLRLAYWNLIVLTERQGDYLSMVKSLKIFWNRTHDAGAKKKVEDLINKLMWSDKKEATESYQKGIELKKDKKIAEAEKAFRDALYKDASFLAAKFEIGMIAYKKGEMSEATSLFRDIVERIPFYGEVHLLLGDISFNRGYYRSAAEHFSSALEYGFLNKNTRYLIRLKRGTSYYNTGTYERAREDIESALKLNDESLDPLLLLSAIHIKEHNYEEALKTLQKAQKSHQNNPEILFQIGSIYYKMDDPQYTKYFDTLFQMRRKEVPQKYQKAFQLLLLGYYKKGRYQRVAEIAEELPDAYKNHEVSLAIANAFYTIGTYNKAISYYERLSLGDDDRFRLCKAYALTGKRDKAKELLQKLSYRETLLQKALEDKALKHIASEVVQEKKQSSEINGNQR